MPALVDLDRAAVLVFGDNAAAPGHFLMLSQRRRTGVGQVINGQIEILNAETREEAAAGPTFAGPAWRLGGVNGASSVMMLILPGLGGQRGPAALSGRSDSPLPAFRPNYGAPPDTRAEGSRDAQQR